MYFKYMKNKLFSKAACLFAIPVLASAVTATYVSQSKANASTQVPTELEGEWLYGRLSTVGYKDITTGQISNSGGASDRIKIEPNGSYERVRLLKLQTYGCSSYLFISDKGTVKFSGNNLTFQPQQSLTKGQSCSASNYYERKNATKPETYNWSMEQDSNGRPLLVFVSSDGQGRSRYNRPQ